jgi:hypothetical protein
MKFEQRSNQLSKFAKKKEKIFQKIEEHLIVHADFFQDLMANEITTQIIIRKSLAVTKNILEIIQKSSNYLNKTYDSSLLVTVVDFLRSVGFTSKSFQKLTTSKFDQEFLRTNKVKYMTIDCSISFKSSGVIMIASFNKENFGNLVYISSESYELFEINCHKLLGNKINDLMPLCYARDHNSYVLKFSEKPKALDHSHITSMFDSNHFLNQINISYKMYPYFSQDVRIVT